MLAPVLQFGTPTTPKYVEIREAGAGRWGWEWRTLRDRGGHSAVPIEINLGLSLSGQREAENAESNLAFIYFKSGEVR